MTKEIRTKMKLQKKKTQNSYAHNEIGTAFTFAPGWLHGTVFIQILAIPWFTDAT